MNSIINFLLLAVGIFICVYSFTIPSNSYIAFKFYNPDFIVPQRFILLLFGIPILTTGIGYTILERYGFPISVPLKWISIAALVFSFFLFSFIYIFYAMKYIPPISHRYYRFDSFETFELEEAVAARVRLIKTLLFSSFPIFILSFLLSVINWIRAVISSIN